MLPRDQGVLLVVDHKLFALQEAWCGMGTSARRALTASKQNMHQLKINSLQENVSKVGFGTITFK